MKSELILALRETGKLTLRYLGVGLCFAAGAGVTLFGLRFAGATSNALFPVALLLGFGLSFLFWRATKGETVPVPTSIPNVEIQSTSTVFGVEGFELGQFATSASVFALCMTYPGEASQPPIETPILAPTSAPEVNEIHADVH